MSDKKAVKTTIVGGQPPGNDRELPPIPVGIEHLLAMAAVDPKFAEALHADRRRAVEASGVELTPTERGILGSIDEPTLRRMVANVGGAIPDEERRAFLGRSAAALLALVGGGLSLGSAAGCEERVKGVRPDKPPVPPPKPPPEPVPVPAGIRPDPPPKVAPSPPPEVPMAGVSAKAPDAGRAKPRGIRPDRPKTRGIRPDRPRPPKPRPTKGIRPDLTDEDF